MEATGDTSKGKILALFVHGLGGKAVKTWMNKNGDDFASLVREEVGIDAHYFSYPTRLFSLPFINRPTTPIKLLVGGLRTEIKNRFSHYGNIVLVCHSLGGIVAKKYITEEIKAGRPLRVIQMVLYATPNTGSSLADIGSLISWRHNQLRQLCTNSDLIDALNEDWLSLKVHDRLQVTYVIGTNDSIVTHQSFERMPGEPDVEVILDRDHINLVKPNGVKDQSFIILKNRLKIIHKNISEHKGLSELTATASKAEKFLEESQKRYAECKFQDSFDQIKRAHDLMPEDKDILRQYVRVCFTQNNFDRVSQLLKESENNYPRDNLLNHWAEYYIRNSEPEKALDILNSIEKRDEYNVEYHTGIAYLNIYFKDGDTLNLTFAREHLQRAEQHFLNHWWVGVNLILIHRLLCQVGIVLNDNNYDGRIIRTKSELSTAIQKEPYLFSARIYRLLLHAILNEREAFDRLIAEDTAFIKQLPKNFPKSWLRRMEAAFADVPDELEYYKCAFLKLLARS